MYQEECEGTQNSKRLKVLILGSGGRNNHFNQILAANIQQWGYEASILSSSIVLGKGVQGRVEGDILVYDLDDALRMSTLMAGKATNSVSFAAPLLADSDEGWPRVRLMIALSSRSVSRLALEQMGAVALLHKPFEMGRLQRYLQAFQKVLLDESVLESRSNSSARILVVEDHEQMADTIRQCLEFEPGYEVRIANDGLDALEQCVAWRPHCIVTDLLMPYMNGYQVMRSLSAASEQQMPAFVVISALTQHELPERDVYPRGKEVVFIDKPFHIEHLLDAVERVLT